MSSADSLTSQHPGLDFSGRWALRLPADFIEHWAATIPDRPAITFIDYLADRSGPRREYTWAHWGRWTQALAHRLQQVAGRTDRVAILAAQGPEYIAAFHAALRAGVIAVPLFAPDLPGHGERLDRVFDDCQPSVVVTTHDKLDLVEKMLATRGLTGQVQIVLPRDVESGAGAEHFVRPSDLGLDDVAYLQYTSGSTRDPAGVELTHRNLVTNLFQVIHGHGLTQMLPGVTTVSWLPLFHDMGLLLGAAATAILGLHAVTMDPIAFILKPSRRVTELAAHPNVVSAAPNFAYGIATKKCTPEVLEGLDFSRVVSLINGAEPVLASTVDAFEAKFSRYGLPPTAQRPNYGLAEATVFICSGDVSEPRVVLQADVAALQRGLLTTAHAGHSTTLVSAGQPLGLNVVIVDAGTGVPQPEGRIGEIWVNGPNVGRGYWGKPEESRQTFGAHLTGEQASVLRVPDGPYLRTGDLGAMIGRNLFITDGRNVYPHDIEYTVEHAHEAIALHRLAAFSVPVPGGEGLVVVAEQYRHAAIPPGGRTQIDAAVRRNVSERHSVAVHDVVLIASDTIPWTSSGKIARRATRKAYLAGTLTRVPGY